MSTVMIGMDIAKRVFYLHGEDEHGREVMHKKLSRKKLVPFIPNLPPSVIAMEAAAVPITGRGVSRSWGTLSD